MSILLYMFALHCLCDYALQGDFMSKAKNPTAPIPGVPWYQPMTAHAMIHAGAVAFVTGWWALGAVEFMMHFITDYSKCRGWITYNQDQFVHVACKIGYAVVIATTTGVAL